MARCTTAARGPADGGVGGDDGAGIVAIARFGIAVAAAGAGVTEPESSVVDDRERLTEFVLSAVAAERARAAGDA